MFVLSSVPIHLVFNSAIFEVNYATGFYSMTLASEAFAHGGAYYPPGASLFNDVWYQMWTYWDESSDISHAIRSTAADAASWSRINADACKEYISRCQPLSKYQDLILVMTSPKTSSFSAEGWIPRDLYNMRTNFNLTYALNLTGIDCTGVRSNSFIEQWQFAPGNLDIPNGVGNYGSFWARHMPLDIPNSLWYRTDCIKYSESYTGCSQWCPSSINSGLANVVNTGYQNGPFDAFEFILGGWLQPPPWNQSMPDSTWPTHAPYTGSNQSQCDETSRDLNSLHPNIDVSLDYCLAQPFEATCMIGASGPFLFTVSVCVWVKTLMAIIVARRLRGPALVTPGDAIESFIRYPDEATVGRVTLGQPNMGLEILQLVRRLESWHFNPEAAVYLESVLRQPRPWRKTGRSGFRSVRRSDWLSSYIVVGGVFGVAFFLFSIALKSYCWSLSSSIRPIGEDNESSLSTNAPVLVSIIIANSPQLLLTLGYFAYNNMFTRLAMAREWFSYASSAQPLRVTDPHGEQVSTYRLQLPYRYSVPLLVLRTGLHWMVSNTFHSTIVYGDYFRALKLAANFKVQGIPAYINETTPKLQLKHSTSAFLVVIIIVAIFAPVPLLMSLRKIKDSNMVGFPSNSHVMSAACHVSTFTAFPPSGSKRPISDTALKDSRTVRSAMLISGQVATIGVMPGPYTLDMTATEACSEGSKPAESTMRDFMSLLRRFIRTPWARLARRAVSAETMV
ncbi:hypothetical protein F5X98DRAFT_330231 [Xylaria grammica]|nr:hypothetical protein F5X98DRAFT_330231 [Xylaria grammica]